MANVKAGSTGRFGPRYGTRTKKIVAVIEAEQKKPQQCPRCERKTAQRIASGIWWCGKCGHKFAGGAYFPRSIVATEILAKLEAARAKVTKAGPGEEKGVEKS
jgi:large subunit ribosomal protein L37Ae